MSNPQSRRRFVRLKTRHAARMCFADGTVVDCEIRDFCPTGLYLSFGDGEPGDLAGRSLLESAVKVEFFHGPRGAVRRHTVQGRVAHCAEGGIGIFATEIAAETFQALLEHRAGLYRSAGEAPRDLDAVDIETIQLQCVSLYRPFLETVIQEFFRLARARGAEEYEGGTTLGFVDALAELRADQDAVRERCVAAALDRVDRTLAGSGADADSPQNLELSLLEADDFDDWLSFAAVINKLEVGMKPHLGPFENFYRLLSIRQQEGVASDPSREARLVQSTPFSPDAICRSFREAIHDLPIALPQRGAFYGLLGEAIALHGPAFYDSLTKVAAVVERRREPRMQQTRGSEDSRDSATPQMHDRQLTAGDAAPTESMRYGLDRILAVINGSSPIAPAAAGPAPVSGAVGAPVASINEVIAALGALVRTGLDKRPGSGNPPVIEQLRERLSDTSGAAVVMSPEHRQALEALVELFDRVMREYAPASELEALMKRIEPSFLKLALADPEFLVSAQHPARQMLTLLDQLAIAAGDDGKFFDPKLPGRVGFLVDNAITQADRKPEIYQTTVQALETMMQPLRNERRRRIQRLQETSEGRHRILQSRIRVATELEARLGGRQVPKLLLRLLDSGWRQYLNLLELRQGMHGADWTTAVGLVERLLAWLAPDFRPAPDHALEVAAVMRRVGRGMATVCTEPAALENLMQGLHQALLDRGSNPEAEVERLYLEPRRILGSPGEEDGDLPADDDLHEQLLIGSWWNMMLEDGKPAAVQLIWLSEPPGSCVFANRSATRKYEFTVTAFARMKEDGQAVPAVDKDLPVLERTDSSLVRAPADASPATAVATPSTIRYRRHDTA